MERYLDVDITIYRCRYIWHLEHGVRDNVVLRMQPVTRSVEFRWRPGVCAAALPRRRAHARMCVRFHRRTPRVVCSQVFRDASAFNANIGAWNTASVTSMYYVCAVSAVARDAARSVSADIELQAYI